VERELEFAVADSVGSLFKRRKVKPAHTHTECLNCGAHLYGQYCHGCGQSADDHHRSILHLTWEAIEGFTHLDGRLAQTLPALLFKPGALARDHIEGRRTRHVPPFRLFLICLLIFMFSMEAAVHRELGKPPPKSGEQAAAQVAKEEAARAEAAKAEVAKTSIAAKVAATIAQKAVRDAQQGSPTATGAAGVVQAQMQAKPQAQPGQAKAKSDDHEDDNVVVMTPGGQVLGSTVVRHKHHSAFELWLKAHIQRAAANREFYVSLVFEWGHRLAVVMLPILAGLLTLLYVYKRKFYVYDHLLVSMQYLSFCFLLWAAVGASPAWLAGLLFIPATIWTPVNLYMTLRGAYGSSVIGAGLKALFLWGSTMGLFLSLLIALLTLALNQI
jgi:hypothetical protein